MLFEKKVFPSHIFIIDELPTVAQKRDNCEKELAWLEYARANYYAASKSKVLSEFKIIVIPNELKIGEKKEIIKKTIEQIRWENGSRQNKDNGTTRKGRK